MMGFGDNNYINWTICRHITTPTVVYVKGDQMMILLMSLSVLEYELDFKTCF